MSAIFAAVLAAVLAVVLAAALAADSIDFAMADWLIAVSAVADLSESHLLSADFGQTYFDSVHYSS